MEVEWFKGYLSCGSPHLLPLHHFCSLLAVPLGLRKVPALEIVAFSSETHVKCKG